MMRLLAWLRRTSLGGERGSYAVEAAILAPAIGLLVLMVVVGGRVAMARQAVESAAADAARSASIARTQAEASGSAYSAASTSLHDQGTSCGSTHVAVDSSGFAAPVGTPASVGATVTCDLFLGGLLPGLPGSVVVTATIRSPLDTYRER